MKEGHDFASAERGKFYHPEAVLSLPGYLDADVHEFQLVSIMQVARPQKVLIAEAALSLAFVPSEEAA
jgi:hypothetical protein